MATTGEGETETETQTQREKSGWAEGEREYESLFLDDAGETGETGSGDQKKIAATNLDKWLELAVWKLSSAPCDLITCHLPWLLGS